MNESAENVVQPNNNSKRKKHLTHLSGMLIRVLTTFLLIGEMMKKNSFSLCFLLKNYITCFSEKPKCNKWQQIFSLCLWTWELNGEKLRHIHEVSQWSDSRRKVTSVLWRSVLIHVTLQSCRVWSCDHVCWWHICHRSQPSSNRTMAVPTL